MRSLLTILFLSAFLSAFSQQGNFDYLQAYRRFTLANRSVKGISNDPAMLAPSADSLVTQYALKGYLYNVGIGIKGLQHQLLGAKSDSTGLVEYLEPLVEGAFVATDDELNAAKLQFVADQVNAIYDLRTGQVWTADNAGNYSIDTSKNYFTTYGVRRFLYNPLSAKTIFVKADSTFDVLNSVGILGEFDPLFNQSAAVTIQQADIDRWNSKMDSAFVVGSDTIYYDGRDFYNQGTYSSPLRVYRYDNHYIDSLFALVQQGGGTGGTVNNYYTHTLPYNGDTSYYLAGDSALHKLPSTGANIKLTTNGQNGPATLTNDTLNIPNYFFANNPGDSIDYSFSSMTPIYNEYGPGEYLITGHGVTTNPNNFNYPFRQLKALDVGGWSNGDYVSFTNSTTANSTAYTFLRGFIKLKQAVPVEQSISFAFYLNGTLVSKVLSAVNYGLNKGRTDIYSNITIPMSAFGFTSNSFDEIRLIFGGGSSPDGLYLDLFQFQNATEKENTYVSDLYRIPGTTTVEKVIGGQNVFGFNDSVGAAVDTIPLHDQLVQHLAAIQNNTASILLKLTISDTAAMLSPYLKSADTLNKWMPRSMPIVNSFNGRSGSVLPQLSDYSAYYAALNHTHTLQSVTDAGNTTTNSITASLDATHSTSIGANGGVSIRQGGSKGFISANNLSFVDRNIELPDHDGTLVATVNGIAPNAAGNVTIAAGGASYTDAQARAAISLTTTGTSGAATYDNSTGVLNVPNYAGSGSSQWTTVNTNDIYYNSGNVGIGATTTPTARLSVNYNGIGTTLANDRGLSIENNTASTSTLTQYSPILRFRNTGWKTNATASSQTIDWRVYSNSVNGAASTASSMNFDASINGASYANAFQINSNGNLFTNGQLTSGSVNTGAITSSSTFTLSKTVGTTSGTNSFMLFPASGATSGVPVQYSPAIRWQGNAWDGTQNYFNAVSSEMRPISGVSPTRGNLVFSGYAGTSATFSGTDRFGITTDGGIVIYPMTKAQRDAIVSPQQGRVVFVSDNGGYLSIYNAGWFKVNVTAD